MPEKRRYPIVTAEPISGNNIEGFNIEYRLDGGKLGKAVLRSNLKSWSLVDFIDRDQPPFIEIGADDHELLRNRTLDDEIRKACFPKPEPRSPR